jgi:BirA family transcriptional regulator, biotin operon repressor / biotin---[acetyl-CoA-carboxylase] ligase
MNLDRLKKTLRKNRLLRQVEYFKSVDSTNRRLMEEQYASGTIVAAAHQSAGRGKHGAKWQSKEGGLWFSFVINRKINKPYMYVILSSVAVTDILKKYGINSFIKWPNDIVVNNKKICGILIENNTYHKKLVTGIGINVNNDLMDAGTEDAVSMAQLKGGKIEIETFFAAVIKRIDFYLSNVKKLKKKIIAVWASRQADISGRVIKTGAGRHVKAYKVISVKKNGTIKAEDKNGKIAELKGEIFFL